jgi:hypothetical protein
MAGRELGRHRIVGQTDGPSLTAHRAGGRVGRVGHGAYAAAKWSVEGLGDATWRRGLGRRAHRIAAGLNEPHAPVSDEGGRVPW